MKIVSATLHSYTQRLTPHIKRKGVWLRLQDDNGRVGVGEAAPWPGFGSGTQQLEKLLQAPEHFLNTIVAEHKPEQLQDMLTEMRKTYPAECVFAFETAMLAMEGHVLQKRHVHVHALVDSPRDAHHACQQGICTLKVKVARQSLGEDLTRLRQIRESVGESVALWIDANGAWSPQQALQALRAFASVRIDVVEQPVPADDLTGLQWLQQYTDVRIAADESVVSPERLDWFCETQAADIVVIKPMFLGGIDYARRMAHAAVQHGLQITVTHALESSVGRYAAACVASSLDVPTLPCGLLGPTLTVPSISPHVQRGLLDIQSLSTSFDPLDMMDWRDAG